jgi:hypothetical protein
MYFITQKNIGHASVGRLINLVTYDFELLKYDLTFILYFICNFFISMITMVLRLRK